MRILLAEDQELVVGALTALLEMEADFEVVAEVGRGDQVLAAARICRPHVVLLDIEMPGRDGLAACAELHAELPEVAVLILTTFARPGYLKRAIQYGAAGFLGKDLPAPELADAIRRVHRGEPVFDPELATEALEAGDNPLLAREIHVLRAAADGEKIARVARALHLSHGTVRNYLSAAIAKTGTENRIEAARVAVQRGWI